MKELEVTVRLRNNRLKERRLTRGLTQKQLARKLGMSTHLYQQYETLAYKPFNPDAGWKESAEKLAKFYRVPVEELFPPAAVAVQESEVTRKLDGAEVLPLLAGGCFSPRLLGPAAGVEEYELRRDVDDALETLTERQREVIRARFGFDGEVLTLREVGDRLGVTSNRIRDVESQALRRLRHPGRTKHLRVHHLDGLEVCSGCGKRASCSSGTQRELWGGRVEDRSVAMCDACKALALDGKCLYCRGEGRVKARDGVDVCGACGGKGSTGECGVYTF